MKQIGFGFLITLGTMGWTGPGAHAQTTATYTYPFQDPRLDMEKRIDNLLSLMTTEEKIACLSTNPSVPRLGVKGSNHIEGLHGVALGGPGGWGRKNPIPTTQFPQAIGLGETWDTSIIRQAAAVEGYEARWVFQTARYQRGGLVIRAPNADLGRDPRWGRTEECYGEDPFFNGTMVAAFVRGLQGNDPRYWQTASLMKHFLGNSNENSRDSSSSDFDEALFREYYSVPFRMGIEAGARAFMASYNAVNGIPMMVSPILRMVTINQWGQNGIICTDGGALRLLWQAHKYYPDSAWAAAVAVKAGINQFLDRYRGSIEVALRDSLLSVSDIEHSIRGVFRVMFKLGLLDPPSQVPYASIKDGEEPWLSDQHKALAREVTRKSIVLLKNDRDFLPLNDQNIKSLAVIGPYADQVLLDWYSGTPPYTVSVLEGIRNRLKTANVSYTTGYNSDSVEQLARSSDVVILVVGNHPTCNAGWKQCPVSSDGKEAVDRKSIYLEEETLIKQVLSINPHTVVVLVSSFPFAITWTQHNVPAILHMTHCSEESGNALADVLFGDYNPGGRLVQTWPSSMDQLPPMMDYNIRDGRTYKYFKGQPLYPFGYGLSYTSFIYSNLRIIGEVGKKDRVVLADIENTGNRTGDEVVQLYTRYHDGGTGPRPLPEEELKGFVRITLKPHEKKTVHIRLSPDALTRWETETHRWVNVTGPADIMIGASSADIRLETQIKL